MDKQKEIRKERAFVDLLNQEMKELQDSMKQKQIEEMAKVIMQPQDCKGYEDNRGCYFGNGKGCDKCKIERHENAQIMADYLYNAGYRKIPENAVVLTREEQTARDYELYNLGYETHRQESQKREDYIKTLEYHINDLERALIVARKETAEKFAERVKEEIVNMKWAREDTHIKLITQGDCLKVIDEICEEVTEGEKCQE